MTTTPREFGLNKPTPFDGDRKKITTFIQEVKIYLTVNKHVYTTDESMVAFVLSYMTEKEAVQWRELYVEQMTDMNGDLVFPTFKKFAEELVDAFKPADRTAEAMNRLMVLKQGDRTAEELVMEFRLLAAQAGLGMKSSSDHIHMIGLFRKTLHPQLANRILFGENVPETIEGWIAKAIQFDTNYRMAKIITEQNRLQNTWKKNERRVLRPKEQKNDDEMNVNMLTAEERNNFMKEGACFKCQKRGHIAKNCPLNKERILVTQAKKSTVKDLVAQIQTMTKEEKMKFIESTKEDDEEKADF
jgi:hypothetical protein